jgi:hypothetical protein
VTVSPSVNCSQTSVLAVDSTVTVGSAVSGVVLPAGRVRTRSRAFPTTVGQSAIPAAARSVLSLGVMTTLSTAFAVWPTGTGFSLPCGTAMSRRSLMPVPPRRTRTGS